VVNLGVPCKDFQCKYEEIEVEAFYSFDRKKWRPIFGQARCFWKLVVFGKDRMGAKECEDCDRYQPRY